MILQHIKIKFLQIGTVKVISLQAREEVFVEVFKLVLNLLDLGISSAGAVVEKALALILVDVVVLTDEGLQVDAAEECLCLFNFPNVSVDDIFFLLNLIFDGSHFSTTLGSHEQLLEEVQ